MLLPNAVTCPRCALANKRRNKILYFKESKRKGRTMESFPCVLPLSGLEETLSSSFGFATCVIMDVLSMETRCFTPTATPFCFFVFLVLGKHHKTLLLQSLGLRSFAVRSSIKIPSYSERALPFPRSSQTRAKKKKNGRNVSGRSNIRGGDSPGDKQSVGPAFRVVRVGCGCSRQHITQPAAAVAARSGCAPHATVSAALFIQRWRPSCYRRGRAALCYNNSNTSTRSVRPPLSLKFISCAPGEEVN